MKSIIIALSLFISFSAFATKKAVTEEGEVVILTEDGRWHYEDLKVIEEKEISVNPEKFTKPKHAKFKIKSTITDSALWIDTKSWSFKKKNNGHEVAEYTLKAKDSDLYGMIITEEIQMTLEGLAEIAIENARSAAPDIQIVKQEYRNVNGNQVMYMELEGTIQSIRFTYLGYYFSDESGATQLLTYTGSNLVSKYRNKIDNLLNGFVLQK